jgi:hypothetical protein
LRPSSLESAEGALGAFEDDDFAVSPLLDLRSPAPKARRKALGVDRRRGIDVVVGRDEDLFAHDHPVAPWDG